MCNFILIAFNVQISLILSTLNPRLFQIMISKKCFNEIDLLFLYNIKFYFPKWKKNFIIKRIF